MCSSPTTLNDLGLTDKNHACACGTSAQHDSTTVDASSGNVVREHYLVEGMTCNHCVSSVTEEVSTLDGVDNVSVELVAGGRSTLTVVSSKPIGADTVGAAVTEAGYTLVSA